MSFDGLTAKQQRAVKAALQNLRKIVTLESQLKAQKEKQCEILALMKVKNIKDSEKIVNDGRPFFAARLRTGRYGIRTMMRRPTAKTL